MRIGVDIRPLLEPNPSGVSEYTYQIVKHLLSIDRENEYLLFCNSFHPLADKYSGLLKASNVSMVMSRVPNKIFNSSLFFFNYPKADKRLGGLDVFFLPNLNFIAVSKDCPLVTTVHDLSFRQPGFYALKSYWWHKFIRPKRIIHGSSRIIAVSQSTKNDLMSMMRCESDKISVINPGVSVNKYLLVPDSVKTAVKKKYKLDRPFVLFLGTVEQRKNIAGLLAAWELGRERSHFEHQLVIAGDIRQKNLLNDFPKVRFLGYVPADDKPALYHLASAFAYPSFYEGFGLPVIEAMAAGTPVIANSTTSIPEVADGAALLVDPYNIEEMSRGLTEIIHNQPLRKKLINRGFEVAARYNWESSASQTLGVLRQAVHKK